ncbi:MAG: hypothetical protein ACXVFU_15270 [Nocardioidaceae bacterium]
MRKALVLGSVAAGALVLALTATPASAGSGDTLVSFTVGTTGTTVSISPGAYVAGVGGSNYVTGTIASTITDLRTTAGSWTDTVSSTDYSLVGATSPTGTALIPASSARMWTSAAVVAVPGTATISNSYTSFAASLALANTAAPLLSATTANTNTTAVTSNVQIDTTGKATGVFTGTITQTVS